MSNIRINFGKEFYSFSMEEIKDILDLTMTYPRRKSLVDKEIKECDFVLAYQCKNYECDFGDALEKVRRSIELKSLGVRDVTAVAVEAIITDKNRVFPTADADGYIFRNMGKPYLYLENTTLSREEKDKLDLRTGYFSFSQMGNNFYFYYKLQTSSSWRNVLRFFLGPFGYE